MARHGQLCPATEFHRHWDEDFRERIRVGIKGDNGCWGGIGMGPSGAGCTLGVEEGGEDCAGDTHRGSKS